MPYKDPAKKSAYNKAYRKKWTPEQWDAHNKKCSEYQKKHRAERSAYLREWCRKNREKHIAHAIKGNRIWRERNPDEAKRRDAISYQKRRQQCLDNAKRWRESNQHLRNHYHSVRRAKKFGNGGAHTYEQWIEKVISLDWLCIYCQEELTIENLTKDHLLPLSKGGGDNLENIVPACLACNLTKNAMTGDEFIQYRKKINKSNQQAS